MLPDRRHLGIREGLSLQKTSDHRAQRPALEFGIQPIPHLNLLSRAAIIAGDIIPLERQRQPLGIRGPEQVILPHPGRAKPVGPPAPDQDIRRGFKLRLQAGQRREQQLPGITLLQIRAERHVGKTLHINPHRRPAFQGVDFQQLARLGSRRRGRVALRHGGAKARQHDRSNQGEQGDEFGLQVKHPPSVYALPAAKTSHNLNQG